jgi:hypothetical protein
VQALLILLGAGFTIAVCLAWGRLIVGDAVRDAGARFVVGAGALSAVVFALCRLHLAYWWVFLVCGVLVVRPSRSLFDWRPRGSRYLLPFLPFFVLYFFHALAPEASPDGAGYHLGLVTRYLDAHGFVRITDNFYAAFPAAVEMLFLHAFAFGLHSAAALVHLAFLVALTWQIYAYGVRAGHQRAGWAAALLVFASPVVGIDAASAYNDVALAAIAFTLFHLLEIWSESRNARLAAAIGLLAGFAVATKFTAWLCVPWAIGWIALKSRRGAVIAPGVAALAIAPWLIKNWLWWENPVAPFFNRVFPNPYLMPSFEDGYRKTLTLYHLHSRWEIPWDVTTRGTLSGLLGPVFLLAPVALLALRTSTGRRVLLAALVFGANYFSNIGTRFLIPPLPFIALAMAMALSAVPHLVVAIAVIHAVISWPAIIPKYASRYSWHLTKIPWREALRIKPEGPYIETRLPYYAIDRLIDRVTTAGSTIFTFTPIPEAYTSRRIRVSFQSAENQITAGILWSASQPEAAPIWRLRFTFPRQPLRHVRVVQTGTGPDTWTVHELRIFDGARELPRDPEWQLRADPSPWDIQSAFDNSPVTFWMCGETVKPGQLIDVAFAREEFADSVLIEAAPNQPSIRLKLEGIAAKLTITDAPRPIGLRRAAAEEAKRWGNDYLLVFPDNAGAADFHSNQDLWGLQFVGEAAGARLYRLPETNNTTR